MTMFSIDNVYGLIQMFNNVPQGQDAVAHKEQVMTFFLDTIADPGTMTLLIAHMHLMATFIPFLKSPNVQIAMQAPYMVRMVAKTLAAIERVVGDHHQWMLLAWMIGYFALFTPDLNAPSAQAMPISQAMFQLPESKRPFTVLRMLYAQKRSRAIQALAGGNTRVTEGLVGTQAKVDYMKDDLTYEQNADFDAHWASRDKAWNIGNADKDGFYIQYPNDPKRFMYFTFNQVINATYDAMYACQGDSMDLNTLHLDQGVIFKMTMGNGAVFYFQDTSLAWTWPHIEQYTSQRKPLFKQTRTMSMLAVFTYRNLKNSILALTPLEPSSPVSQVDRLVSLNVLLGGDLVSANHCQPLGVQTQVYKLDCDMSNLPNMERVASRKPVLADHMDWALDKFDYVDDQDDQDVQGDQDGNGGNAHQREVDKAVNTARTAAGDLPVIDWRGPAYMQTRLAMFRGDQAAKDKARKQITLAQAMKNQDMADLIQLAIGLADQVSQLHLEGPQMSLGDAILATRDDIAALPASRELAYINNPASNIGQDMAPMTPLAYLTRLQRYMAWDPNMEELPLEDSASDVESFVWFTLHGDPDVWPGSSTGGGGGGGGGSKE